MKRQLIGISGKKNTGKDTVGDYLWQQHGYFTMAFADPLKDLACMLFGWDRMQLEQREYKEGFDPALGMTRRVALQRLGTEAVRGQFGEMFWVNTWARAYEQVRGEPVVVTDVREEHEAKAIRELGGLIVHLKRNCVDSGDTHSTEAGIMVQSMDYVISNNGTLGQLYDAVDELIEFMEVRQ